MPKIIYKPYVRVNRKKRPGVHAKSKTSNSKQAKNYKKKYIGQGR